MAKREKPKRSYYGEELKMLLGKTTDKLIERAEARSSNRLQNLALPGKGEVYQYQLRELVQHCVMAKGYEKFLEEKMNACGFWDCMDALRAKIDARAIEYFLKRVDMEFRVSQLIDGIYSPNPEKGLQGLFMRTDRSRRLGLEGKDE